MAKGGEDGQTRSNLFGEEPHYDPPTLGTSVNEIIALSVCFIVIGIVLIVLAPVDNGPSIAELLADSPTIFVVSTGIVAVYEWLKKRRGGNDW